MVIGPVGRALRRPRQRRRREMHIASPTSPPSCTGVSADAQPAPDLIELVEPPRGSKTDSGDVGGLQEGPRLSRHITRAFDDRPKCSGGRVASSLRCRSASLMSNIAAVSTTSWVVRLRCRQLAASAGIRTRSSSSSRQHRRADSHPSASTSTATGSRHAATIASAAIDRDVSPCAACAVATAASTAAIAATRALRARRCRPFGGRETGIETLRHRRTRFRRRPDNGCRTGTSAPMNLHPRHVWR